MDHDSCSPQIVQRESTHTLTHTHTHRGNDKSKLDRAGRVWPQEAEIRRIEASLGK
jgi:hypothetical protein